LYNCSCLFDIVPEVKLSRKAERGELEYTNLEVPEMAAMFFHVEERKAWVRTGTHTIVYDRDPDYPRFERDPSGSVKRMLRIWLAERNVEKPLLRTYLGTVTFCFMKPSLKDLYRLFHLTTAAAKAAGQSARALRRDLADLLREYMSEECQEPDLV
jgi:hypothetical protein